MPDDALAAADAVPVLDVALALGANLKRVGAEHVGPCPACGGTDRFSVNPRKNVWHCRVGAAGGGPVHLRRYVAGETLHEAVAALVGDLDAAPSARSLPHASGARPASNNPNAPNAAAGSPPAARHGGERGRPHGSAPDASRNPSHDHNPHRRRAQEHAYAIWRGGERRHPLVARYFASRGITAAGEWLDRLRLAPALPFMVRVESGAWVEAHRGPCLLAPIVGPHGRFIGLHRTWLAADGDGKARIAHPETGAPEPVKKVLGSQKGGRIVLASPGTMFGNHDVAPATVALGEGIESCAAWCQLHAHTLPDDDWALWCGVNLGNIAGRAVDRLKHPIVTRTDARGRVMPTFVPGVAPAADDDALALPDAVDRLILVGDNDGDVFRTTAALARAASRFRWALPDRQRPVEISRAPFGGDWNDALQAAAPLAAAPSVAAHAPSPLDARPSAAASDQPETA